MPAGHTRRPLARHTKQPFFSKDIVADHKLTITQSPFWSDPGVTKLIADARNDSHSRSRLAGLVYRPAFRRIDEWLAAAGLKQQNMQADDIFDVLWVRDLATAIERVDFQDREHFMKVILKRSHQVALRKARQIRGETSESLAGNESDERNVIDPAQAADYADVMSHVLRAMKRLASPQYEIVNLRFFEGMTFRQLAEELQMPRSTVHYELGKALKELRDACM